MTAFDVVAGFWIVFLLVTIVVCIHDATRKK